jgi:hypothetical protein
MFKYFISLHSVVPLYKILCLIKTVKPLNYSMCVSAMQHYQLAADYFRGEESNSAANKCLVKVAQYAAQLDNFEKGKLTL